MFIGREKELTALNDLYNSGKLEFVVLYGRRRVGKTELIKHFIDDKNAIYFTGDTGFISKMSYPFSSAIFSATLLVAPLAEKYVTNTLLIFIT